MAEKRGTLKVRVAVLEATTDQRADEHERALALVKEDLSRRLEDMNHWRAEEIADKADFLRSSVYEKSEDLHRMEVAARDFRISTLEIRITQVATIGAIAVMIATTLTPILALSISHYLFK